MSKNNNIVCARCTKPITTERIKIGIYTYCKACGEKK